MGNDKLACRGLVSGRVQGVGFRYFVRSTARQFALSGSATNLQDGRVEIVLYGRFDDIELAKVEIEKGPALARVSDISWEEIFLSSPPQGFRIG